jgi:hypothetical protein
MRWIRTRIAAIFDPFAASDRNNHVGALKLLRPLAEAGIAGRGSIAP